jgi:hypothetical protein
MDMGRLGDFGRCPLQGNHHLRLVPLRYEGCGPGLPRVIHLGQRYGHLLLSGRSPGCWLRERGWTG